MEGVIGHKKVVNLVDKIVEKGVFGRGILIEGVKGIGKFTLALKISEKILGKNPFLSNSFLFYRNDDFLLKTQFYLKYLKDGGREFQKVKNYFMYLFARTLRAIALGEISNFKVNNFDQKGKIDLTQFIFDIFVLLSNDNMVNFLLYEEILLKISEEISKKKIIPINFVREWKDFDNFKKTDDKKVVVIGDFETASIEAQNSALKILEEPSEETLVVLTTSESKAILPTIVSRCLVFKMDKLMASEINEIFKIDFSHDSSNTIDFMREYLFGYGKKVRERMLYFFEKVAPFIQKEGKLLFEFSENLSKEGREFVISFIEEILLFLKDLHLGRQFFLRNSERKAEFSNLIIKLSPKTYVSEIHSLGFEVIDLIQKLKNNENFSISLIMTDFLIKISRWYQKAIMRKIFL